MPLPGGPGRSFAVLSETLDTILTFMGDNAAAAYALIFVVATLEAVLLIGLFVPSTAVLVGAGALVGTGTLPLLPVLTLTALGAILGDALSYWIGRRWGGEIAALWPLSRYPGLVTRGETFFRRWGGWSVFLGRFVPALKSVIPGIAGMMGMPIVPFTIVNVSSAIVWAAAHILPGAGIGLGLSSVPEEALIPAAIGAVALLAIVAVGRRFFAQRVEEGRGPK